MDFVFLIGFVAGTTAVALIGLTLLLIALGKIDV